jgi:hypothetical protein
MLDSVYKQFTFFAKLSRLGQCGYTSHFITIFFLNSSRSFCKLLIQLFAPLAVCEHTKQEKRKLQVQGHKNFSSF